MLGQVDEPEGLERVRAAAREHDVAVEIRERPAADSLEEAARILGIEPADIAKSVVIRAGSDTYLIAMVPGDRTVAWPKLRALLGVSKLKFPSAEEAREVTGYERGTITPLGTLTPLPVYVDAGLAGRRVSTGAGAHGYSAFVEVDDLVRGLGATIADIAS